MALTVRRGRPPQRSRAVGYTVRGPFAESAVERVLGAAKQRGEVTEYDTGRGRVVWFNGPPGEKLRALRKRIEEMAE